MREIDNFDTSMTFNDMPGSITISQRTTTNPNGTYNSEDLLSIEIKENIMLSFGVEDGALEIDLSSYHNENPETRENYHCRIKCSLSLECAAILRNYLKFLTVVENARD